MTPHRQLSMDKSAARMAAMFDDIAPYYDFLNHFLSLHIDKRWRKKLVRAVAQRQPAAVLDVATGTGDLAIALRRQTRAAITAVDISEGMLAIAQRKATPPPAIHWLLSPAEALPFPGGAFDAVTVAFGVRNFENLTKGLQEMHRVLQPGGFLAILEFASPVRFPVKQLYRLYFHTVLPLAGRLFSRHRTAYRYLPASVSRFPQRSGFLQLLQQAGFKNTRCQSLSCGIAMLYMGEKN
ncbi:MAG: bifunctional demethylmenaquinone methyltransferase/2-methoxy-6-polyprenyl-1,4-benzoquinol methylase UbiE [Prevotellaceae bacterium]|jgi:demethylmenaquinone methyltransferase/2-methoxy-6-polyprenyl-1,4-benzoquinol methylase|nr:bifunctional demethylmenaquinone methyltransferase/2-methoxy-6-polyprenyl-1,4-benzoquinol methylase UbiE [Prevotellaceae bacterium]